jgi:hypothetical protein
VNQLGGVHRPSDVSARRYVISAVALLAVAARLTGLFTQALSQDEVASARIITEPTFPRLLGHVARTESTPPLWYTLAWLAHHGGLATQDVRLLSVAAGAVTAALVVDLACGVVGLPFAALAGLMTAIGSQLVSHGRELRAYELLALLAVVFARAVLAEVEAPSRRRELALVAVVAAGGLTHYFFAFTVLAGLGWLWLDPTTHAVRRRATGAIALGAFAAAPWLPVTLQQYHQHRFWWIGAFRVRPVLAVPLRLFTSAYGSASFGFSLSLAAPAVVGAGCVTLARLSPRGRLVAALAVGPHAAAALAWVSGVRIFGLRNLIEIAPFVAIAIAVAASAIPRRAVPAAALLATVASLLPLLSLANVHVPQYDLLARRLVAEGWTPSAPVAVFGNFFLYRAPLEWYLPHRPLLAASRPLSGVCRTVFVIRRSRVERLRLDRPIEADRQLDGATILADPADAPHCVRPIMTGRLAPLS